MSYDISLFHFFNNLVGASPLTASIAVFFAYYFPFIVIVLSASILFFAKDAIHLKAQLVLTALFSVAVANGILIPVIRIFIERPRPFVSMQTFQLLQESSLSFPSGHATAFFALGTAIFLFNKKLGGLFLVFAAVISIARVMAGIHYPSDILAGAILGSLVAYCFYRLFKFLLP